MDNFRSAFGRIARASEWLTVVILLAMITVATLQILSRFIYFFPLPWSQELCQYLNFWLTFLGAGLAVRSKSHVILEVLVGHLKGFTRRVIEIVANAIGAIFSFTVVYQGIILFYHTKTQTFGTLHIPMKLAYLAPVAGAATMAIFFLEAAVSTALNQEKGGLH